MSKDNQFEKVMLRKYKPNTFIIFGVIFNILIASVLSIFLPLVVITIPAIILNSLLLIPRVNTKRYWAVWKIIPIILSFILGFIVLIIVILVLASASSAYESFSQFIDTIVFWDGSANVLPAWNSVDDIRIYAEVILITASLLGNIFLILGWYNVENIGYVEVKTKDKDALKNVKSDDIENRRTAKVVYFEEKE